MPADLRTELADAAVTILKGDLNYRRLVGDRHWPPTTPFAAVADHFPSPVAGGCRTPTEVAGYRRAPSASAYSGPESRQSGRGQGAWSAASIRESRTPGRTCTG